MMPELRNWQVITNFRGRYVLGNLYNDPRIEDGTFIRTAKVLKLTGNLVTTRVKTYRLIGDPA